MRIYVKRLTALAAGLFLVSGISAALKGTNPQPSVTAFLTALGISLAIHWGNDD